MITIDEVRAWVSGEPKYNPDFALKTAYLAISQHEEIGRLRDELKQWEETWAAIRALKAGELK